MSVSNFTVVLPRFFACCRSNSRSRSAKCSWPASMPWRLKSLSTHVWKYTGYALTPTPGVILLAHPSCHRQNRISCRHFRFVPFGVYTAQKCVRSTRRCRVNSFAYVSDYCYLHCEPLRVVFLSLGSFQFALILLTGALELTQKA